MGLLVGTMSFAGGTAAYLSKSAGEVKNVFTAGSVKAQLTEAHWDTHVDLPEPLTPVTTMSLPSGKSSPVLTVVCN